ncbi:hypothetical protein GGD87_003592 [Rhodobaca bogoriensis DSM 18756]|nr:hypothetical protein [Rhodobaca bogoriensis DSM 18756]
MSRRDTLRLINIAEQQIAQLNRPAYFYPRLGRAEGGSCSLTATEAELIQQPVRKQLWYT